MNASTPGCHWSNHEIHANWFQLSNVSLYVPSLSMEMSTETKSYDMLVSIQESMPPLTYLPVAHVLVWRMTDNDCLTILLLQLFQFALKPFHRLARIHKLWICFKIVQDTLICIQRNYFGWWSSDLCSIFVCKSCWVITPSFELFGSFRVNDHIFPGRGPSIEEIISGFTMEVEFSERIGIMITECRIDSCIWKAIKNLLCYPFEMLSISLFCHWVTIVADIVSSP